MQDIGSRESSYPNILDHVGPALAGHGGLHASAPAITMYLHPCRQSPPYGGVAGQGKKRPTPERRPTWDGKCTSLLDNIQYQRSVINQIID